MNTEDRISKVCEDITESFEKVGLYLVNVNVATSDQDFAEDSEADKDFREKLANGEAMWVLQCAFTIGKVAWSDRVLNPDKFAEDQTFREIMPDEADLIRQRYLDAAKSGDITKVFDLEDEDGL